MVAEPVAFILIEIDRRPIRPSGVTAEYFPHRPSLV
jgi:hypothetical protein